MCGIAVAIGENSYEVANTAIEILSHRGPDGKGIFLWENVAIAFARLAINDLSSKGMQPFHYNGLIGVFNGEIYNAKELAQAHEIPLNSDCDIEVILPLFSKFHNLILEKLDGFYSGVIINTHSGEIFTLRDYIGKKPLFSGRNNLGLFIVSELKAISGIIDFTEVPLGMAKFVSAPPYLEVIKTQTLVENPAISLEMLVKVSIQKRIPIDNEQLGVFLSGGLDSSIIAAMVSSMTNNAIYFSLGNPLSPDFEYINLLKEHLHLENLILVPLPDMDEMEDLINEIVYHTESYNPSIISNGLSVYLLAKEAKKYGLKVVLSGEGADEVFCGYHSFNENENWSSTRLELIKNLHMTELRRVDLAAMAHSIEIRCPFLDREIVAFANTLTYSDFYATVDENLLRKNILRKTFKEYLPDSIINRQKTSMDVGSGIRSLVIDYLTRNGETEVSALKNVWLKFFPHHLKEDPWFHSYPAFDHLIAKRKHKHE